MSSSQWLINDTLSPLHPAQTSSSLARELLWGPRISHQRHHPELKPKDPSASRLGRGDFEFILKHRLFLSHIILYISTCIPLCSISNHMSTGSFAALSESVGCLSRFAETRM
jgi:hypothetical protein